MKMKTFLVGILLILPTLSFAQGDEFPFTRAIVVNSPAVIASWPVTAHITGVHFEVSGWRVDFDRRLGANAWPNIVTPGWDGPLQYTLGLCRKMTPSWVCSSVVEFWQHRLEDEGVRAGAPPSDIAKEWFYDGRWGALASWQPALGEEVGVYIQAGDGRNTTTVFPGTSPQRTAARLLRWGTDIGGPLVDPPKKDDPPIDPPRPVDPPHSGLIPSDHDQLERIFANLTAQNEDLRAKLAALDQHLTQHDNEPMWITKFLKSPIGIVLTSAGGTCAATQCWRRFSGTQTTP